jgi:hypothetical protein
MMFPMILRAGAFGIIHDYYNYILWRRGRFHLHKKRMLIVMIFIAKFGKFYTALSMTKRYLITYKKQNTYDCVE